MSTRNSFCGRPRRFGGGSARTVGLFLALAVVTVGCPSEDDPPGDPSSADVAPDVPDVSPDVPDVAPDVPDVAPDVPDVAPDVPDVAPDVPDVAPDVPDVAPDVPDVGPDVPDVGPDVPDVGPDVPDVSPDVPDVSPDVPDVGPDVPDVAPDVPDAGPDVPDVGPDVPDVSPDVPDVAPDVPDVAPDVPDVGPDVPDVSPDVPDVGPDVPDVGPDVPDVALPDETPPVVVILAPTPGQVVNGQVVLVTGTASDPEGENGAAPSGLASVTVNGLEAALEGDTFSRSALGLNANNQVISVIATDAAGNTTEVQVTVTVEKVLIGLQVIPPRLTFDRVGAETPLSVLGLYNGAGPEEAVENLGFETADPEVVTVTADGLVTVTGEGATTISVTWKGQSVAVPVLVELDDDPPVSPRIYTWVPRTNLEQQAWLGRAEAGATVSITGGLEPIVLVADERTGQFNVNLPLVPAQANTFEITVADGQGNTTPPAAFVIEQASTAPDSGAVHVSMGDIQIGTPGGVLIRPLVAIAVDNDGFPIPGATITFDVLEGAGALAESSDGPFIGGGGAPSRIVSVADAEGRAHVWWRMGEDLAEPLHLVRAALEGDTGLPAFFRAWLVPRGHHQTVLEGRVLNDALAGVPGVTITIPHIPLTTTTDARGRFILRWDPAHEPTEAYVEHVLVDGLTASTGLHARIMFEADILPGQHNELIRPYFIPAMGPGVPVATDEDGVVTEGVILERSVAPGVLPTRVHVPVGTKIIYPDGLPDELKKLWLIDIAAGRTPMPLGEGAHSRHMISVQPGGARFFPPLKVEFPNLDGVSPGEQLVLRSFDHDVGRFVNVGSATVDAAGDYAVTDPGSGIAKGAWHGPPPRPTADRGGCTLEFTVQAPDGSGDPDDPRACLCHLPDGRSIPCLEGETLSFDVDGCDGSSNGGTPENPGGGAGQQIEVTCDRDDKPIKIKKPKTDGDGRTKVVPEDDGKVKVQVDFDDEECDPEDITWTVNGEIAGVFAEERLDLSQHAGETVRIEAECNGASDVVEAEVLDGCCSAGAMVVCGDEVVEDAAAPEVFRVSGNLDIGHLKGEMFLHAKGTVICKPNDHVLLSSGTVTLFIDTSFAFRKLPRLQLFRGPWVLNGSTMTVTLGLPQEPGEFFLSMGGLLLAFNGHGAILLNGLALTLPELPVKFNKEVKLQFDSLQVTTDGIVPGGKIELKTKLSLAAFGIPNTFLMTFLAGFDALNDKWKFGGTVARFAKVIAGEPVPGDGLSIDFEAKFGKGRFQSFNFDMVRSPPVPLMNPALQAHRLFGGVDNLGWFDGTSNRPFKLIGGVGLIIGPPGTGPVTIGCTRVVPTPQLDLSLEVAANPFQIALDGNGRVFSVGPAIGCSGATSSLLEGELGLTFLTDPLKLTGDFEAKVTGAAIANLAGKFVKLENFPFLNGFVGDKKPFVTAKIHAFLSFSPNFRLFFDGNASIRTPPFKIFGDSITLIPELKAAGKLRAFYQDTLGGPDVSLTLTGFATIKKFTVRTTVAYSSKEGFDLSACFQGICFGSEELSRAVFSTAPMPVDVPANLPAVEINLTYDGPTPVSFTLQLPDGTTLDPAVAGDPGVEATYIEGLPERTAWIVEQPPGGTWQIIATSDPGSAREVVVAIPDRSPTISIDEPLVQDGNTVTIPLTAADADGEARIIVSYDSDREPGDETFITEVTLDEANAPVVWDTSDVAPGHYFVKAAITDDVTPGVEVWSRQPIAVLPDSSVQTPRLVQAVPEEGALLVSWVISPDETLAAFDVSATPIGGGPVIRDAIAASETQLRLDGLRAGVSYRIQVCANDLEGNRSGPAETTASPLGTPAVRLSGIPALAVFSGQAFAYTPTVQGGGAAPTLQLAQAPGGMLVQAGTVSWSPGAADEGEHDIVLTASDPAGGAGAEQRFRLTVVSPDGLAPPQFFTRGPTQGAVGLPYTYAAEVRDTGKATVETVLVSGPEGMTLTDGLVQWTPTAEQAIAGLGAVAFTLVATDLAGLTVEQTTLVVFDDPDADGLSTGYERGSGLDPFSPDDADADPDDDGLSHLDEAAQGTRGDLADTDGDGVDDGAEVVLGGSPRRADTDGDGLDDAAEQLHETNPGLADTDGDGVNDGAEVQLGTDPTAVPADTDGDGLFDDHELQLGTDPADADADGDGCNDAQEVAAGTRFDDADTDKDGVDDCTELANGTDPVEGTLDSDGDRIMDDRELVLGTNAGLVDTDGDGIDDGVELTAGTDPLDPESKPEGLRTIATSTLVGASKPTIFFENTVVDLGVITVIRDDDLDGLPNAFEIQFGLDPNDASDALTDSDEDGLTALQEFGVGTDPTLLDTDDDGVSDSQELQDGTDPLDETSFFAGGPVTNLVVTPGALVIPSNTLFGPGTRQVFVTGQRDDGSQIDLTAAITGTTYELEDPALGLVDGEGLVIGNAASAGGDTTLTIRNGDLSVAVPVRFEVFTPQPLVEVPLDGLAGPVAIAGEQLVVVSNGDVQIVDVSNPAAPAVRGTIAVGGTAHDVALTGNLTLIATDDGIALVDIETPEAPTQTAFVPTPTAVNTVTFAGGVGWAGTADGLVVFELTAGQGLVDQNADGIDDRILTHVLEGSPVLDVSYSFSRGVAATPSGARPLLVGASPDLVFVSDDVTGGLATARGLARGQQLTLVTGNVARQFLLLPEPAQVAQTDPANNFDLPGALATWGDVVFLAQDQSNDLVTAVRAVGDQLNVLGSINYASVSPATEPKDLVVSGDHHFISANGGGLGRLIVGQHNRSVDTLGNPPSITLVGPAPDEALEEGRTVTYAVRAIDDVGIAAVELRVDGEVVANLEGPPFATSITLPNVQTPSVITLEAAATDVGGNVGTMDPVDIAVLPVVDTQPPAVAFTSPTAGSGSSGGVGLDVAVNVVDDHAITEVRFFVDGVEALTVTQAPWSGTVLTPAVPVGPEKTVTITAQATDIGDNVGSASVVVQHLGLDLIAQGVTTIGPGDASFDGADILVRNGVLSIDGAHDFGVVRVAPDGVLTHPEAPAGGAEPGLDLNCDAFEVQPGGLVDLRGRGYRGSCDPDCGGGYWLGNTQDGGAGALDGASHGGRGGRSEAGTIYGEVTAPFTLGAGGGSGELDSQHGGHGGGRVRVVADTITVAGSILADGDPARDVGTARGGGGAGGSIQLNGASILVTGTLSARGGGSPNGAGGSGGRIAVRAADEGLLEDATMAAGGAETVAEDGGAGTVYLERPGAAPTILLDNAGAASPELSASLGLEPLEADLQLIVRGGARVETGSLSVAAVEVDDAGSLLRVSDSLDADLVSLQGGGVLAHRRTTPDLEQGLDLTVNTLFIDAFSAIDVSELGYAGNCNDDGCIGARTLGNVAANLSTRTGGSHGGVGGSGELADSYGEFLSPFTLGGGGERGNNFSESGGNGGGRVRIVATEVVLDGGLLAHGEPGSNLFTASAGGGAGGSVNLTCDSLSGAGLIGANGGASPAGRGGGGGRIAVRVLVEDTFAGQLQSRGGTSPNGHGSAGTIYSERPSDAATLLVHNGGLISDRPTGALGTITTGAAVGSGLDIAVDGAAVVHLFDPLEAARVRIGGGGTLRAFDEVTVSTLDVLEGGRLEGTRTSLTDERRFDVQADVITVSESSTISVTAQGYAGDCNVDACTGARTDGNTPGAGIREGGSHGGVGGQNDLDTTYGDPLFPDSPGGGGGRATTSEGGGIGGGRMTITASTLDLAGTLAADGQDAEDAFTQEAGGGAGGSLRLDIGTLTGAGNIRAAGGSSIKGPGGGGGRIAVRISVADAWTGTAAVHGGAGPLGDGGSGTYYEERPGLPKRLVLDNEGRAPEGFGAFAIANPEALTDVHFEVRNGTRIALEEPVAGAASLTLDDAALQVPQSFAATGACTLSGASLLTHAPTGDLDGGLVLSCASVSVGPAAQIDVSGGGYAGNCAPLCTADALAPSGVAGAGFRSGGTFGGVGDGGDPGDQYGDALAPFDVGAGGGRGSSTSARGGAGGGRVRITTPALTLDGTIRADGEPAVDAFQADGGGGAGGSIWIDAGTVSGSGSLSARGGGSPNGGPGAGGRILVVAANGTFDPDNADASGGAQSAAARNGGAGTVVLQLGDAPTRLIVRNASSGAAPAGFPLSRISGAPEATGFDVVVRGGAHAVFPSPLHPRSVVVADGGVISHPPTTVDTEHGLIIGTADSPVETVSIDAGSRIDLDGLGYLGGGNSGQARGHSFGFLVDDAQVGGTHGGRGGGSNQRVWGDPLLPRTLGGGGGRGSVTSARGGAGGGRFELHANDVTLDGTISVRGRPPETGVPTDDGRGGAGGSVLLVVDVLSGAGAIDASGGSGTDHPSSAGGAGGRIALHLGAASTLSLDAASAFGGPHDLRAGGAGTVALISEDGESILRVDNGGVAGALGPIRPAIGVQRVIEVTDATITVSGSPWLPGQLVGARVVYPGGGDGVVVANTASTLTVAEAPAGLLTSGDSVRGVATLGRVAIRGGAAVEVVDRWLTTALEVTESTLSHAVQTADEPAEVGLDITASETMSLGPDSVVDVSGLGHPGRCAGGPCNTVASPVQSDRFSGGSYGGEGGGPGPLAVFGSAASPVRLGTGGGHGSSNAQAGGAGGGRIHLVADVLVCDATVRADGEAAVDSSDAEGGGGSGGAIWLEANTVSGSCSLTARGGGSPNGAGGGGGRISVNATVSTDFTPAEVLVDGGVAPSPGASGSVSLP